MTKINVSCSRCGHKMGIEISTIDTLRQELAAMTRDRDFYKQKCTALELQKRLSPFGDIFDGF